MRLALALCCLATLLACQPAEPDAPAPAADSVAVTPTDASLIEAVRPGLWMHTTYRDVEGFGRVRSNGIVVGAAGEALLVDAGWSADPDAATRDIVDEIARLSGTPVARAVFTHYHDDSVAGLGALRAAGIPTYATAQTADLMAAHDWIRPDSLFPDAPGNVWTLPVGDQVVEVFYPGPGHTVDNVVVYVPQARVLYTGCLVRPGDTPSLGNTADADVSRWAESVARVRERYGNRAEVVIPSHGDPGGPELLDHTIALVEAHGDH